jgi:hypothetical protein
MIRLIGQLLVVSSLLCVGCGSDDDADTPVEFGGDTQPSPETDLGEPGDAGLADAQIPNETIIVATLVDNQRVTIRQGVGRIEFEAPDDVLSLTVIIHGEPDGWYGVDSWIDGDGRALVTADWPGLPGNERGCFSCRNFADQSQGASTTIAPNRDEGSVHPGRHQLAIVGWIDGFAAHSAQVTVMVKRGPNQPLSGVLDLNFYFTGAQGWTAESVQTDSYFAASLQRFSELYGRIGMTVGDITFHDLDPALSIVSIAQDNDTLGALMAHSVVSQTHGLNVFFVDEILTGEPDFPSIPGVSASVPNPPYLPGTVASGVAIATRGPLSVPPGQRFLDPPAIGQTLCHELGHALGMFHTSEYDEISHDAYDDTPENDNSYLMHADGTGSLISPEQARALLANPAVRHPNLDP